MFTLVRPGGTFLNYTYSTIDFYDRLADIEGHVGMELARTAHPQLSNEELEEFFNRTGPARSVYKTELWKQVWSTNDGR